MSIAVFRIVCGLVLASVRSIGAIVAAEAEGAIAIECIGDIQLVADKLSAEDEQVPAVHPGNVVVDRPGYCR